MKYILILSLMFCFGFTKNEAKKLAMSRPLEISLSIIKSYASMGQTETVIKEVNNLNICSDQLVKDLKKLGYDAKINTAQACIVKWDK